MILKIFNNQNELAVKVATQIVDQIKEKPDALICFATGESPMATYKVLVQELKTQQIDFTKFTMIGLDEWVNIPPENSGSCAYFLHHYLIAPLQLSSDQYHLFNAMSPDLNQECLDMDNYIKQKGGLDLIIVGIGMNGHIGFNEPGTPNHLYTHVIDLDTTTTSVGQKYFSGQTTLSKGITLGLQYVSEAKQVILIASGDRKASIIKQTLEGPITPEIPATILRKLENAYIMTDQEAASLLDSPIVSNQI